MTQITKRNIYKLDLKIMGTLIALIFVSGGSWYATNAQIERNTKSIEYLTQKQKKHIKEYQNMNAVVIKNNVQLKNIKEVLDDNKSDLKYLIRKANQK